MGNTPNKPELTFLGKYIITADIVLKTGLHIGGTEEGFDIGGIDNPVIKDKVSGLPYIPGSSLKGKMRSLLEWAHNKVEIELNQKTKQWEGKLCTKPSEPIGIVFGVPAENHKDDLPGLTRLTVRDAYPDEKQVKEWEAVMGEKIYTEIKTENAIDRLTSAANPRSMERIPANSVFKAEFVYDVYRPDDFKHLKLLFQGMLLLEDAYLGGGGTRGSGQIKFEDIKITVKNRSEYIGGNEKILEVKQDKQKTPKEIMNDFDKIFSIVKG